MRSPLKGTLAVVLATILVGSAVLSGAALGGVPGVGPTAQQQEGEQPDEVTQDTAFLRAFHASPDAPAVDVLIDNETVVSDVEFGEATEYLQVEGGEHRLTIQTAENGTVVYDSNVTIEPRSVITVAASGEVSENAERQFAPLFIRDDAFTPSDDEAALAVAHLSPDAGTVDVTLSNGSVVADNASYGTVSDYLTVPAGDYTLEIREATENDSGEVLTTVDVSLNGGEAYTAYAVGYLNASDNATVNDSGNATVNDSGNATVNDSGNATAANPFEVVLTQDATHTVLLPSEDTETANETETATETPFGNETETETPFGNETETPFGNETETETPFGEETATETPFGEETETETPFGNETETETESAGA